MEFTIQSTKAFRVMGISMLLSTDQQENFKQCAAFWGKAASEGTIGRLASLMNGQPAGLLGVSFPNEDGTDKYCICVATTAPLQEGLEEFEVPETTWAIFKGCGKDMPMQELQVKIVNEWLPTSGYEYLKTPDMDVYVDPDPVTGRYEVWIPVGKKE